MTSRLKDIQYSSRAESHLARQQQIHQLRHVVRELGSPLPESVRAKPQASEWLGLGCCTVTHVLTLRAPALEGEDQSKDIDFSPAGIEARWSAGRELVRERIAQAPWKVLLDPSTGIVVHG